MKKTCKRCVMDSTVPNISFDAHEECSYCRIHDRLVADYPRGEVGKKRFADIVEAVKRSSRRANYDCIVGFSGGTDSTYLLHLLKEQGLRPLAVNFDNGWHSETAVHNIKNTLDALGIDLRTYVVDWEEMRNIHLAFLKASLPWPDGATDIGIVAALYHVAAKEKIKYIMVGNDFRSEGKQPRPWTYIDAKQIRYVAKHFGNQSIKNFPKLTIFSLLYYRFIRGIRCIRPFWYLEYKKTEAKKFITERFGWRDYGGHHHESIFTRFNITFWLPKKFQIDKRKVTYSALVRSGEISRDEALNTLKEPPCPPTQMEEDLAYVIKKLGISRTEFDKLFCSPNRSFQDYPSYHPLFVRLRTFLGWFLVRVFSFKPMMFYETEAQKG